MEACKMKRKVRNVNGARTMRNFRAIRGVADICHTLQPLFQYALCFNKHIILADFSFLRLYRCRN